MRITASILLLSVLAFNWFGFQLVSQYLQNRASLRLESKLDKEEYMQRELIEIKVPMSLPYQNSYREFERCYGEIQIKGVHYTYVKRRIYNDSLVLLCLPNTEKTKLANARDNFFEMVNGLQSADTGNDAKKDNTAVYKNLLSECLPDQNKWSIDCMCIKMTTKFSRKNALHCVADFKKFPNYLLRKVMLRSNITRRSMHSSI